MPIALKRIPAKTPKRRGVLWLLYGGPGGSGVTDLDLLAGDLPATVPDLDYVSLDHRGVGESERLGCRAQESPDSEEGAYVSEAEWPSCIASLTITGLRERTTLAMIESDS